MAASHNEHTPKIRLLIVKIVNFVNFICRKSRAITVRSNNNKELMRMSFVGIVKIDCSEREMKDIISMDTWLSSPSAVIAGLIFRNASFANAIHRLR